MAVARETEVEGQHREIVGVPEVYQRSGQSKLSEVGVQGNALNAPERIGEIGGRCTNRARHISESQTTAQVRFQELFGSPDQAAGHAAGLAGSRFGGQRGPKQGHCRLFKSKSISGSQRGALQEASPHSLQLEARPLAPVAEQGMNGHRADRTSGNLLEELRIGRDYQLGVIARSRLAQVVALTPGNKQHLIGIADDLVAPNVPDEQTPIRQTDLKGR